MGNYCILCFKEIFFLFILIMENCLILLCFDEFFFKVVILCFRVLCFFRSKSCFILRLYFLYLNVLDLNIFNLFDIVFLMDRNVILFFFKSCLDIE